MGPVNRDPAAKDGWERIFFHEFDGEAVRQFRSEWSHLRIRTDKPAVASVSDGLVPALARSHTRRNRKLAGVYDAHDQAVETSWRLRDSGLPFPSGFQPTPLERADLQDAVRDRRNAYYLGVEARKYGHFLLETLCRAWAWDEHGGECVPVLQSSPIKDFARALLRLIPGIAERVELVARPTRFDKVVVPAPAFTIRHSAHTEMKAMFERMAARALPSREPATEQPLYLSRSALWPRAKRALLGELRFETFLEGQGFRIVHPETLPIPEQIALFNRHKWIVAPQGSACHSRLFAREPINLLVLTDELHPNYVLCDLLSDGTAHYGNVFSSYDYLAGRHLETPVLGQPKLMDDERCLAFLKAFDLVRADAVITGPRPDMSLYRKKWIEIAEKQARRKGNTEMSQAIRDLENW